MRHVNTGNCEKCDQIFNRYPGFHQGLRNFFKNLQKNNPEAHISCAGRGRKDQEKFYKSGASRAHYGQSAHNVNMALDVFKLHHTGADWSTEWFIHTLGKAIESHNTNTEDFKIKWYGTPGSKFLEYPHCEVENWKNVTTLLVD